MDASGLCRILLFREYLESPCVVTILQTWDRPLPQIGFRCQDWWCHTYTPRECWSVNTYIMRFFLESRASFLSQYKNGSINQGKENDWGFLWWLGNRNSFMQAEAFIVWTSHWHQRKERLDFLIIFPRCGTQGKKEVRPFSTAYFFSCFVKY